MSRPAHAARKPTRLASVRRCVLFVLRAVLLALAFQVSGLSVALAVSADACGDELTSCPLEKQGEECPPHCPQCHCVHVNGLAAPASQSVLVGSPGASARVGLEPPESWLVPSPLRSNPYRPPRWFAAI